MDKIDILLNAAEFLNLSNIIAELNTIKMRDEQENACLILPLVGEFSSGKTTLINSLTDSKKLETATKPTTATIYEVHFGCDECKATILNEDNEFSEVNDIAELKNETLTDAKVVTVFDTSKRVPSTTILVDTPGLSSPDPKHKQTLVNFLPKADGILLVTDINQQITRSLTDFIETMKLSKKPIFLILTKSDTKSDNEIEAAKKYISDNCQIPLKQVAVVSASKGYLDEIYALFDNIQKSKNKILKQVDGQRIINISNSIISHIDELMKASSSDKELDAAIKQQQYELDKISRNINLLVESMSDDIEELERNITRKFEDTIFSRLNSLVVGKSTNFDNEAISIINNTASLLMNDYKNSIQKILSDKAKSKRGTDNEVSLDSLLNIDMASIQMNGLSYNLDLNSMGHEYDGWIKTGVIAIAAVGAVVAVGAAVGAAGAASAAEGAGEAGAAGEAAAGSLSTAATFNNAIDVADTVSDVGSIVSNQRTIGRLEKATNFISNTKDHYNSLNETNQQMGQQVGSNKGMIDSMVGFVTEKLMSKPQRVRAIRNFIDSSLAIEFKDGMKNISNQLISSIRLNLQNEAVEMIEQKTSALSQLKSELKEKKDLFDQKMIKLREYKTNLLTL